ncbi:NnrS family protein [Ectothiorhodospiraceae bacterium WFHF3C12]|nr:NnrS family protein [Ectothiorhodospiraceae bacterium WFHF3C12]
MSEHALNSPARAAGVPVLLAYPFRPFFLLTAAYAVLLVLGWTGYLALGLPLPLDLPPLYWHGHEMLIGLVPAAIAGFLLTAMSNWTGAPPLRGAALAGLIAVWLAGRVVMWVPGWLPHWLVAAVDLAFLPVMAIYAFTVLARHGNRRNYGLAGVLGVLAAANALMHAGIAGGSAAAFSVGQALAMGLIAVLIAVIAGRITPAFTRNWLRMHGGAPERVHTRAWLDRSAIATLVLVLALDLALPGSQWTAFAALAAAVANGARLAGWGGYLTLREPLLWVLHLGYLWLVVAMALKGLAPWLGLPDSAWIHALGTGSMSTLILGVMARVSLGHTGRPMRLPAGAVMMFWLISGAALLRVGLAGGVIGGHGNVLVTVAIFWVLAFGLFFAYYSPILTKPRADGRPG